MKWKFYLLNVVFFAVFVIAFFALRYESVLKLSKNWTNFDVKFINPVVDKSRCSPLSAREQELYDKCYKLTKITQKVRKFGPIKDGTCCFQNGSKKFLIGLGSFPGSGNTWLRGLLQKVTGICTGSLYCDGALRTNGFTGEGIVGPSVIVVKSHSNHPHFTKMDKFPMRIPESVPVYDAALLLLRDPRNAMIAEWHREKTKRLTNKVLSNHYLSASKEYFGTNKEWNKFIHNRSNRWLLHVSEWATNGKHNPVHIVKYEDLKTNTGKEILKIINFLKSLELSVPFNSSQLESGYNAFHRNHMDMFDHFTPEQEFIINQKVQQTISLLIRLLGKDSAIIHHLKSYHHNST